MYAQYKAGVLSKGQYDYQRGKLLKQFAQLTGPVERLLLKGKTALEAIRINRSKAIPATQTIASHVTRLNQLSRLAKGGGVVLAGVGMAGACGQIGATQNRQEKNEIFFETLGGTLSSGLTGYAIGLMFIGTPVGWGLALVLASTTMAAGLAGGWIIKERYKALYNKFGDPIDLVSVTGIDALCK